MPYKKIIGIYKIVNKINDKLYIGSAVSIYSRFAVHKRLLKNNNHFNNHLQSSWNLYGENNFCFEIVLECDKNTLEINEEYYIKHYRSNDKNYGYNRRIHCKTNLGIKYSDEHKLKLSKAHLGIKHSDDSKKKIGEAQFKKVYKYNLAGKFIEEYSSMKQAAMINNIQQTGISMCCRGLIKKSGGFIWSYVKNDYICGVTRRTVLQLDKNNILIKEWETPYEVVKQLYIKGIYNCLNGLTKTSGGYRWKYKNYDNK